MQTVSLPSVTTLAPLSVVVVSVAQPAAVSARTATVETAADIFIRVVMARDS